MLKINFKTFFSRDNIIKGVKATCKLLLFFSLCLLVMSERRKAVDSLVNYNEEIIRPYMKICESQHNIIVGIQNDHEIVSGQAKEEVIASIEANNVRLSEIEANIKVICKKLNDLEANKNSKSFKSKVIKEKKIDNNSIKVVEETKIIDKSKELKESELPPLPKKKGFWGKLFGWF